MAADTVTAWPMCSDETLARLYRQYTDNADAIRNELLSRGFHKEVKYGQVWHYVGTVDGTIDWRWVKPPVTVPEKVLR